MLLAVDYSQVELRVLAHIANEPVLKDIFHRGEDVHTETASAVFELPPEQLDVGMRSKAKMVNYGIVYGLSALRARRAAADPAGGGAGVHRPLPRPLPGRRAVHEGRDHAGRGARVRVHAVRPPPPDPGGAREQLAACASSGERLAANTIIQGTAADIIKVAMVRCHDALEAGRAARPAASSRSTTSSCSRARRRRWSRRPRSSRARWSPRRSTSTRRSTVDAGVGENWLNAK